MKKAAPYRSRCGKIVGSNNLHIMDGNYLNVRNVQIVQLQNVRLHAADNIGGVLRVNVDLQRNDEAGAVGSGENVARIALPAVFVRHKSLYCGLHVLRGNNNVGTGLRFFLCNVIVRRGGVGGAGRWPVGDCDPAAGG